MGNESTGSEEPVREVTINTFEIEQYRSLRGEILRGTEDGNQVMSYGLAAIGIVITAGMTEKNSVFGFSLFAILIPGLSSLVLSLWFGTLERIARASFFITGIESRLKLALRAPSLPTWDVWLRAKTRGKRHSNHHFWTTEYSGFLLFVFLLVGPLAMSFGLGGADITSKTKLIVIAIAACAEVGFLIWMLRRVKQWKQWLSSIFGPDS